jgi:60 kDa SS-A/Ro ribonucleoprotein
LADAAKGPLVWKAIARQMGPQALRMNLNTLLRHEVFGTGKPDEAMVEYVADRIADAEEIRRSRQFPYQYLAAYLNAAPEVPQKIKAALAKAAEIACGNVGRTRTCNPRLSNHVLQSAVGRVAMLNLRDQPTREWFGHVSLS